MIKILICCASGSGTSQLMAITAQKACKSAGVEANVKHCRLPRENHLHETMISC